ncbi:MAG: sulfur carrier protein ThiS [Verrucomicrobiales bacterium]
MTPPPDQGQITVNGKPRPIAADTALPALLGDLGVGGIPVLVEHNGIALRPSEHAEAVVKAGDRLEIIRVVAGG